jgi:flavin-dependent dehydrogenase
MSLAPTLHLQDALRETWDLLVIGAGPAGCLLAQQAAHRGLLTLLVDAKPFPRDKVCGGCISARALAALRRLGLAHVVDSAGAAPLNAIELHCGLRAAELPLPSGAVLTRHALDAALATAAIAAGAEFLPETSALVDSEHSLDCRRVALRRGGESGELRTKLVIGADGLGRASTRLVPELASRIALQAKLGVGTVLEAKELPAPGRQAYPLGRVVMTVAAEGYVGIARGEVGRTIVAAAVAPRFLKQHRTPAHAANAILATAGLPPLDARNAAGWHGTPLLTSYAQRVATARLFMLGDAAGYVEPFTGEGMAWAAEGAEAIMPLVEQACTAWSPALIAEWEARYRSHIFRKQAFCRMLAVVLRQPWAASLALGLVRGSPALAARLVSWLHQSSQGRLPVALQT